MNAESAGTGGGFTEHRGSNLQGNVLSDQRTRHSGESVNITVRNLGGSHSYDRGSRDVTLAGGASQSFTAGSKEIAATEKKVEHVHGGRRHHTTGRTVEGGSRARGWFVRVVAEGKAVAARGSAQAYEDTAKDDAKLKALSSH